MARGKSKKQTVVGQRQGTDLVVLAGLPRVPLASILNTLSHDTSKKDLSFGGTPSIENDWMDLYRQSTLTSIEEIIRASISRNSSSSKPTPRRILILYVPSKDDQVLIARFGIACYLEPLVPPEAGASLRDRMDWRHEVTESLDIISDALRRASTETRLLQKMITDNNRSALALPPRNFYFPDRESLIYESYLSVAQGKMSIENLNDALTTKRFTKDHLPAKALKGDHHRDRFFQDLRGRVFPPDIFHAPTRSEELPESSGEANAGSVDEDVRSRFMRVLHQRYRFGVVVRNGNLHYDVQYEIPKQLYNEPMYCADAGNVLVTGSHANVGVNDVIWVPDGEKKPANF